MNKKNKTLLLQGLGVLGFLVLLAGFFALIGWAIVNDQTNVEQQKQWTQDAIELDNRIAAEKAAQVEYEARKASATAKAESLHFE